MNNILNYMLGRKLFKKYHISVKNIANFSKHGSFLLEESSSTGKTEISKFAKSIGAHSYIKNGYLKHVKSIGRFCSIGSNVSLGQPHNNHPLYWASSHNKLTGYSVKTEGLVIGNDVWIGNNVTVMSGLTIGDGAVIGTGAIVTKDIEPYQIVAGVPAKPIKYRFDEATRIKLIESQWWNKPYDFISTLDFSNISLFIERISEETRTAKYRKVIIKNRKLYDQK